MMAFHLRLHHRATPPRFAGVKPGKLLVLVFNVPPADLKPPRQAALAHPSKEGNFCLSEPFACHPERSEGSLFAQGKLREKSFKILRLRLKMT